MDAIWRFFMPRAQRSAVDNPPLFTIAAGLKEPSNTKSWPMKLAMNLKSKFAQAALGLWLAAPALALASSAAPEAAPDSHSDSIFSGWTFGYAPYTYHFSEAKKKHEFEPDVKHSYVWLVQAEKRLAGRSVAGLALFSNSFGQPSQYLYYGWRFTPLRAAPGVFFKLSPQDSAEHFQRLGCHHHSGGGLRLHPAHWRPGECAGQIRPDVPAQLQLLKTRPKQGRRQIQQG